MKISIYLHWYHSCSRGDGLHPKSVHALHLEPNLPTRRPQSTWPECMACFIKLMLLVLDKPSAQAHTKGDPRGRVHEIHVTQKEVRAITTMRD